MRPFDELDVLSRIGFNDEQCWTYDGNPDPAGYHSIAIRGRLFRAHRWTYEYFIGPIPEGLVIDHLCRNPGCVNPAHLEPVTVAENARRGIKGQTTHCPKGHEYTPENTRVEAKGNFRMRHCRQCHREQEAERKRQWTEEQKQRNRDYIREWQRRARLSDEYRARMKEHKRNYRLRERAKKALQRGEGTDTTDAHMFPGAQERASEKMDEMMRAAIERRRAGGEG